MGAVDTQCSINLGCHPGVSCIELAGEEESPGEWFSGPGAASTGEKPEGIGDAGRPTPSPVEAQLLENGSLSPNDLSARVGSKPEERIDPSDLVGVHSLENGSLSWQGSNRVGWGAILVGSSDQPHPPLEQSSWRMVLYLH